MKPLLGDTDRNIRREAIRAHRDNGLPINPSLDALSALVDDPDPEVRAEVIRTAGALLSQYFDGKGSADSPITMKAIGLLAESARAPLAEPTMKSTSNGRTIKAGEAYEREFERYIARMEMEKHPAAVAQFLATTGAKKLPLENRLVATLALDPKVSASRVAELLAQVGRSPGPEEILRLAQFLEEPGASNVLKSALQNPITSKSSIEILLRVRTRLEADKLVPLLSGPVRRLLAGDSVSANLGIQAVSAFQISELEGELVGILQRAWAKASEAAKSGDGSVTLPPQGEAAMRGLREMRGGDVEVFASIVKSRVAESVQKEALAALAASKDERGPSLLLGLWRDLSASQRNFALARLTGSKSGAHALMAALKSGVVARFEVDRPAFDKLQTVLGDSRELRDVLGEMATLFQPCLRLNGADNAWAETDITLTGAFTVEAWVKLDPGIDNNDGILGSPARST